MSVLGMSSKLPESIEPLIASDSDWELLFQSGATDFDEPRWIAEFGGNQFFLSLSATWLPWGLGGELAGTGNLVLIGEILIFSVGRSIGSIRVESQQVRGESSMVRRRAPELWSPVRERLSLMIAAMQEVGNV